MEFLATSNPKSVVIVGNSQIKLSLGQWIDSHDLVIRFNDFASDEFVGKKTDIWCFSTNIWGDISRKSVKCREIWCITRPKVSNDMLNCAKNIGCEIFEVPKEFDELARTKLDKVLPSTGIVAVLAAIHYFKNPIKLVGFSGVQDGIYSRHSKTSVQRDFRVHNWKKEQRLLDELIQDGKVCKYSITML